MVAEVAATRQGGTGMQLVVQTQLMPTAAQRDALLATMERVNAACDAASRIAWKAKVFKQYDLHHLAYRELRTRFDLSSQMAIHALAKVANGYAVDHDVRREFEPRGAIAYDSRVLSWKDDSVSIWTLGSKRERIPFVIGADRKGRRGEHQRSQLALLRGKRGESDLVYRGKRFYLLTSVEVAEAPMAEPGAWLGVDLGKVNIAVDSDGNVYSGAGVEACRVRHAKLRAELQACGTPSAKRHLQRLSERESRFNRHTNHEISKELTRRAKDTGRGIALEDLTGITKRVTVRHSQRAALHSWPFYQLRLFTSYKAAQSGVLVGFVNPANTSRRCPECGYIDMRNRKSQSEFRCLRCGFAGNADHVGARNIAARATVNWPIVAATGGVTLSHASPPLGQLQSLAL
jgi:IS605 OrfB family transposase